MSWSTAIANVVESFVTSLAAEFSFGFVLNPTGQMGPGPGPHLAPVPYFA